MNPIESLLVDELPVNASTFAVPEMSLSSARATMRSHQFCVVSNAVLVAQSVGPAYEKWIEESKADDQLHGAPQDELARAGYPEFPRVFENPELSSLVLGGYLLHDFLGKFTWDGCSQIQYWLDSVETCDLKDGYLYVRGRCYSRT